MLTTDNTALVLDSTADLPGAAPPHPNWRVVPLYLRLGDEQLRDWVDISAEEFYRHLRGSDTQPRSSQPAPGDFAAAFGELDGYERILALTISSKLSGTYESARLAAEESGGRVVPIDSGTASGAIVLLAEALQRRLERGAEQEELLALVQRYRRDARFAIAFDTLDYLVRGGRVGRAAGLAGALLSTKPILEIRDGEVVPAGRVRGRARSLAQLERVFAEATGGLAGVRVAVVHADAHADAERLVEAVRRARPDATIDLVTQFGPVLGTNAGPGAVGIAWFADGEA